MTRAFEKIIKEATEMGLSEDILKQLGSEYPYDDIFENKKILNVYATYLYSFYEGIMADCEAGNKLRQYSRMKSLKNYLDNEGEWVKRYL